MTTSTTTAPRLTLRLPGTWLHLDPSRPDLTETRIRAYVEASIGRADQLANARADLRKALGTMLERGEGPAAHQSTFLCHEIAPGLPTPIAVSVFAPTDVRMSPVIGTNPQAVIAGFLRAMEVLGARHEWEPLVCTDGRAARRWRVVDQGAPAPAPVGQPVPTFAAEYWRTVPSSKRLVLVTVTSPLAIIPQTMLRLSDTIVSGSRFAPRI